IVEPFAESYFLQPFVGFCFDFLIVLANVSNEDLSCGSPHSFDPPVHLFVAIFGCCFKSPFLFLCLFGPQVNVCIFWKKAIEEREREKMPTVALSDCLDPERRRPAYFFCPRTALDARVHSVSSVEHDRQTQPSKGKILVFVSTNGIQPFVGLDFWGVIFSCWGPVFRRAKVSEFLVCECKHVLPTRKGFSSGGAGSCSRFRKDGKIGNRVRPVEQFYLVFFFYFPQ